ncbi:MAG: acyl-CoA thioesterase [Candidatus Omnitrophica bacterium]|nr:acyl-CoA thioesterase [Candidatus Omnitrophota bacterium]
MKKPEVYDWDIRVRYSETDQMGVTYYANYFVWFEVARTEYFRSKGVDYTEIEKRKIFLAVVDAQCKYLAPTRYDDLLTVRTWIGRLGKTSMTFGYEIIEKKSQKRIAQGNSSHVFVNEKIEPVRIPEEVTRSFS